jgi:ankyrin repeat protein
MDINKKDHRDSTIMHRIAYANSLEKIHKFLEDVGLYNMVLYKCKYARILCKSDVIKILLKNGGDPNVKNCLGEPPLHIVCYMSKLNGDTETIKILLDFGADHTIKNIFGKTPLDCLYYDDHKSEINKYILSCSTLNQPKEPSVE